MASILSRILMTGGTSDPSTPEATATPYTGAYTPEDEIAQQYKLSDALRRVAPATSWAGVAAKGLGAIGGNFVQGDANQALSNNQSLRQQSVQNISNATDPASLDKALLTSQVPEIQNLGLQTKIKQVTDDPSKEYRIRAAQAAQYGLQPGTPDYRNFVLTGKIKETDPTGMFGKQGAVFQGNDGGFYTIQFGGDGTRRILPVTTADGAALTPAKGVGEVDTGTGTQIINKATGAPVRMVDKDISGASSQKEIGTEVAKAKVNLPTVVNNADKIVRTLDSVINDPYLPSMVGPVNGYLPNVSAKSQDLQAKINQINGQSFLQAFASLRGGGAITEIEGQKATESLNRLQSMKVGTPQWLEAAKEFRSDVIDLAELAKRKASGNFEPLPAPRLDTSSISTPKSKADYDALPSGASFYDPQGNVRVKP